LLQKALLKILGKIVLFRVISTCQNKEGAWKGPLVILIKVQLKNLKNLVSLGIVRL